MNDGTGFFQELKKVIFKNKSIFYSALLVFSIPAILFFSTFYSLGQFEKNFNHLIQTKGTLLENIFIASLNEDENEVEDIQRKIEKIVAGNQDIQELKILEIGGDKGSNTIIASSDKDEINEGSNDLKEFLALANSDGIAGLVTEGGVRFWEVVKKDQINGGKDVIVKAKISLREVDEAFQRSINRTYWAIILASLVLILLVTNYVRLNQYVLMYNKIKEVDEMKDDFVSMASHELKTPLTAINGYLDLLSSSKKKLNKDEQHYLDNIQSSSTRLKALVEDILEVSRIEQGRINFEYSTVSASEMANKVVDTLLPKANEKKIKLTLKNQLEKEQDLIKVDPSRLEQILVNLVGNSIKYTEAGSVEVIVGEEDKKVKISVEDTGIGMSSEEKESLFGKFNRIKNEKTSKVEGTGLGLWITKQLTEQMKGDISVESIKGKGSRFFVVFDKTEAKNS
jgi:signal transduction histidine kinase